VITATMKTIATPPYQKHMSARLIFDDRNATRTLFIVLSLMDDASEEGPHHALSVGVVPMKCHISLFARYRLFSMHGGYLRYCNGKKGNCNTKKLQRIYGEIPDTNSEMTGMIET
jgi:hypothetical protein